MRSIAFINQKGGVGKTTSVVNIGAGLARLGKKVLLIDFDPHASLTYSFVLPEELSCTTYDLLKSAAAGIMLPLEEVIIPLTIEQGVNLSLVPSSMALSALEHDLEGRTDRNIIFKQIMQQVQHFDYVLVDCPPTLGLLTINALSGVNEIFVPVQTEYYAFQALSQLVEIVRVITQSVNPQLKLAGIIGTRYNHRKLHKEIMNYLRDNFHDTVFKTCIRENIALAEAPSFGKDVHAYAPKSIGAEDYNSLCQEIVELERNIACQ